MAAIFYKSTTLKWSRDMDLDDGKLEKDKQYIETLDFTERISLSDTYTGVSMGLSHVRTC